MPKLINGEICNLSQETKEEIQIRLRSKESQKARNLLTQAMGHYQALQIRTQTITIQILKNDKTRK